MGSNKQGAQKSCHYSLFKGWGFFFPSPYRHLVFIVLCSFRDQYIYTICIQCPCRQCLREHTVCSLENWTILLSKVRKITSIFKFAKQFAAVGTCRTFSICARGMWYSCITTLRNLDFNILCPVLGRGAALCHTCPHSVLGGEPKGLGQNLPCWSASAVRETSALTAGNVMLDMAATAPAAHIILQNTQSHCSAPAGAYVCIHVHHWSVSLGERIKCRKIPYYSDIKVKCTYQGSDPKPYHASCSIWNPRPSRMVFLFPMDRMSKLKTIVWQRLKKNKEKHILF